MLAVSEGLNHLRWALYIYTGLRWNNIQNLTWSQIEGYFIRFPASVMKSTRLLSLPICTRLQEILANYRGTAERDRRFRRRSYPTILKYFGRIVARQVLRILRSWGCILCGHTYATKLYHSGVPLLPILRLLDHSPVRVTKKYFHIQADEMTEAVANLSY